jgi:hypothetical protein
MHFHTYSICLCYISILLFKATVRLAGALEKSTEVMSMMQKLIKVPQIQAAMMELSKEMMKVSVKGFSK